MAVALSGSIVLAGSITGSLLGTSSYSSNAGLLNGLDSSVFALTSSLGSFTSSLNDFSSSINTYTASNNANIAALNAATASLYNATASLYLTTASLNQYTASLNTRSASFACIDSTNNFACAQYFSNASNAISFSSTGSLYSDGGMRLTKDLYVSGTSYFNNVTVFGTQSINYITSSQLNIASNLITVNTSTPAVRFGGLAVYDSGSLGTGLTGSILWDSENNHWVYSNPSGSSYSGGMFISGPRSAALGSEQGTTACALMMGQGGDHITSSAVFHYGNSTCFYGQSFISSSGNACFSGQVCSNTVSTTDGTNTSTLANNFLRFNGGDFYFDACAVGGNINFRTSNAGALDNTALFICGANSRVGIGTNTPSDLLTLQKNDGRLRFNTSAGTRVLYLGDDFGNGGFQQIYDSAGAVKVTLSAGVSYFNGGNVGIGCTNPSYPLDVKGAAGNIARITDGTSHITFYAGSGLNEIATVSPLLLTVNGTERMRITSTGIACFACQVCAPIFASTNYVQIISSGAYTLIGEGVGVNEYGAIDWDSTNNRLRIATQPYAFGASGGQITLTTGGNVGIGTTSPNGKLEVAISSGYMRLSRSGAGETDFSIDTSGNAVYDVSIGAGQIFRTNGGTERMRITSTGIACFACQVCAPNIRIQSAFANLTLCGSNTTSPHVGGTFSIDTNQDGNGRTIIGNSAVNRAMFLEANGAITFNCLFTSAGPAVFNTCVGIGTTTPYGRLHLTGIYNGAQNTLNLENNWPNTFETSLINFWAYYNNTNPQAVIEAGQDSSATNAGTIMLKTMLAGATPVTRMKIFPSGLTCFQNTVCAPNFFTTAGGTVSACRFYTATQDVAVNNGVFTDIFCSYGNGGVWLVSFTLNGNPGQIGYAIVGNAFGTAITLLAGATGAQTCITTSGLKLQVCQTSGANLTARVSSILLTNIIA